MAEALHKDNATIHQLKDAEFDLILRDACYWPAAFLQDMLDINSVELWPTAILMPWLWESEFSLPNPVAYLPQVSMDFTPNMSFWQRVRNYLQNLLVKGAILSNIRADQKHVVQSTGQRFGTYETGVSSSAAAIAVGDWSLEIPVPLPPKVHMVGPILLEDAKPLPADLKTFLDKAVSSGLGAVYVSMGTLAVLSEDEVWSMAAALSALKNPVLWKLDRALLPGNMTWESLQVGFKIKFVDWSPQNDVLAHPGVKLFLTQSGINSLYEAAYNAVPMVSVPIIGDQINNAAKAKYHGIALTVNPNKLTPVNGKPLQQAIERVLRDPIFKENAIKVSKRLRNRPRHPAELAADVVERVLATGADDYLSTAEHTLSWWQLSLVDVKFFLLTISCLLLALVVMVVRALVVGLLSAGRHLLSKRCGGLHTNKTKAA
ncbi:TPA: UDP-glycosyltransferase-like protein [Trebouxia sp. C0004]